MYYTYKFRYHKYPNLVFTLQHSDSPIEFIYIHVYLQSLTIYTCTSKYVCIHVGVYVYACMLQYVAVCCSVLWILRVCRYTYVAVCCSVLQRGWTFKGLSRYMEIWVYTCVWYMYVEVCCSVLQRDLTFKGLSLCVLGTICLCNTNSNVPQSYKSIWQVSECWRPHIHKTAAFYLCSICSEQRFDQKHHNCQNRYDKTCLNLVFAASEGPLRFVEHTATYGNTLQHNAPHCNTLQHNAPHCTT